MFFVFYKLTKKGRGGVHWISKQHTAHFPYLAKKIVLKIIIIIIRGSLPGILFREHWAWGSGGHTQDGISVQYKAPCMNTHSQGQFSIANPLMSGGNWRTHMKPTQTTGRTYTGTETLDRA